MSSATNLVHSGARAAAAPVLFLPGIGWLVFDGGCWRHSRGPDGFGWPSFDLGNPGGRGRDPPRRNGGGDRHGLRDFLDLCVEPATGGRVPSAALLAAVNEARRQAGQDLVTSRRLADELKRRGLRKTKSNRAFWLDIKLAPGPPPRTPPRPA